MWSQFLASLAVFACAVFVSVSAAPSATDIKHELVEAASRSDESGVLTEKEVMFMLDLVAPLKRIAQETNMLYRVVEKMAHGELDQTSGEVLKRQGAGWDQDYQWGGGRFGKRADMSAKRYDMYGMSGRFGRDTSRARMQQLQGGL